MSKDKTPKDPIKILIGLPSNGTWLADSAWSIMNITHYTVNHFALQGIPVEITTDNVQGSLVCQNRNKTAVRAIKEDYDYIWFFDVDMVFPLDAICRLIEADKDIIGINAVNRGGKNFTARVDDKVIATTEYTTGLNKVSHIGTGGILIKVDVLKKMKFPYFFMAMNEYEDTGAFKMITDEDFKKLGKESGREIGEDYYFCENAKRLGYDIWVHQAVSQLVIHIGNKGYRWEDYYIENCFKDLHKLLFQLMGVKKEVDENLKDRIYEYIDKLESYKQLNEQPSK